MDLEARRHGTSRGAGGILRGGEAISGWVGWMDGPLNILILKAPTVLKTASEVHVAVNVAPLLSIFVHRCPLLSIVVHCFPLLSIVAHCCPLLLIAFVYRLKCSKAIGGWLDGMGWEFL